MKLLLFITSFFLSFAVFSQTNIQLVKAFPLGGSTANIGILNNKMFLRGISPGFGEELFVSDGTTTGTTLLKDLQVGSGSGAPEKFFNALGKLFFTARPNNLSDTYLYVTDGTAIGTYTLIQVYGTSHPIYGKEMGGKFYFRNSTTTNGSELWVTDGTVAGTMIVKDIRAGVNDSDPNSFQVLNNKLYFSADDGVNGIELWGSDGTSTGTTMVKNINPSGSSSIVDIIVYNSKLYFGAGNPNLLYESDGTLAGTVLLSNMGPSGSGNPSNFILFNNKIYFTGNHNTFGGELFQSDGTAAGTTLTADINSGIGSSVSYKTGMLAVGNKLYFSAQTPTFGEELYVYSATTNSVTLVKDVNVGIGIGFKSFIDNYLSINTIGLNNNMVNVGSNVVFVAHENYSPDKNIWITDGTPAGSSKIVFAGATQMPELTYLTVFNNEVYFFGSYTGTNNLYKLTGLSVGINENETQTTNFSIYPNPTNELVNIKLEEINNSHATFTITDFLGKIVVSKSMTENNVQFDVSSFAKGIYFITVKSDNKVSTQKLIIQ
jgi:ELWxxDGT repeat protein